MFYSILSDQYYNLRNAYKYYLLHQDDCLTVRTFFCDFADDLSKQYFERDNILNMCKRTLKETIKSIKITVLNI